MHLSARLVSRAEDTEQQPVEGGSGGTLVGRELRWVAVAATEEGERLCPPACHAEAHHVGCGGHQSPRCVNHLHSHLVRVRAGVRV